MNESKDRAALRELADQYEAELRNVYVDDMPECMVKAREALAQPDPVPALVEALREAMSAVEVFHGKEAWEIYRDHSPEMNRWRAALKAATGE